MKIAPKLDTTPLAGTEVPARAGRTAANGSVRESAKVDSAAFSAAGAQIAAGGNTEFDQKKVDEIRQAISEGRFTPNAGKIADALIRDAQSLLAPRI